MPKIKIKSNPYEKQITYWEGGSDDAIWCQIVYGDKYNANKLIKDCYRENYFTNVMNEVFPVLVDEFGDRQNKLEIQFEGVSEEYDSACNEVKSKYSNDIKFLRGEYFLKSVDDVLKFERDVVNEIKKCIPENYIEEFESSITEILKNLKNESANKYQVAMDTKSSLEKLNSDIKKNLNDEIDSQKKEQREEVETNISGTEQYKESSIKVYNERITEFNNFVDGLKQKDVIDVEDFLKCFDEMVKELQKDKKSEDEIKREKVKFLNKELLKRIRAFRDEADKQLHEHIYGVGEWVETIVKNNKRDIIREIPRVEEFCDEMLKKHEKFNGKSVDSDPILKILNWVIRGGVLGIALRFLAWWVAPIITLLTELFLDDPDKSKIKEKLREFNTKFASEFSKWYDKNIQGNVEKYFVGNQTKIEKYFSTELQKLEKTKNELGGQIEQLNGYLEILDCRNKEINGLLQWENSK